MPSNPTVDEMWPEDEDPVEADLFVAWFTTCGTIEFEVEQALKLTGAEPK